MSKEHVSKVKQSRVEEKVELKLNALDNYLNEKDIEFVVPKKFSWNWFCKSWEVVDNVNPKRFESISKSGALVKENTPLRVKIDCALERATEFKQQNSKERKSEGQRIKELNLEVDRLGRILDAQLEENVLLKRELVDERKQHAITKANLKDFNTQLRERSKLVSLVEGHSV